MLILGLIPRENSTGKQVGLWNYDFYKTLIFVESGDYLTFPRIIQELLSRYSVRKLTVTMAHGRWNLIGWGLPPQPSSPTGAQVFAEFEADQQEDADERMKFLVEALNGVLCTSISHINVITSPEFIVLKNHGGETSVHKRYGVLSGETTCTENLTRLRKLLACKEVNKLKNQSFFNTK